MNNVLFSYWCKLEDIAAVTFSKERPSIVIAFTMFGKGKWYKIEHGGGNFEQEAKRVGTSLSYRQVFYLEYASGAVLKEFEGISKFCNVVFAHKMKDGFFLIQGAENSRTAIGGFTGSKYGSTRAKLHPPDKGIGVYSQSESLAPICELEEKEFEAL